MLLGANWSFILKAGVPQAPLRIKHDLEIAVAGGGAR
jgi:hypothetical protein